VKGRPVFSGRYKIDNVHISGRTVGHGLVLLLYLASPGCARRQEESAHITVTTSDDRMAVYITCSTARDSPPTVGFLVQRRSPLPATISWEGLGVAFATPGHLRIQRPSPNADLLFVVPGADGADGRDSPDLNVVGIARYTFDSGSELVSSHVEFVRRVEPRCGNCRARQRPVDQTH
jgi:hypothetical protein